MMDPRRALERWRRFYSNGPRPVAARTLSTRGSIRLLLRRRHRAQVLRLVVLERRALRGVVERLEYRVEPTGDPALELRVREDIELVVANRFEHARREHLRLHARFDELIEHRRALSEALARPAGSVAMPTTNARADEAG